VAVRIKELVKQDMCTAIAKMLALTRVLMVLLHINQWDLVQIKQGILWVPVLYIQVILFRGQEKIARVIIAIA
jgi:hypothetical protein